MIRSHWLYKLQFSLWKLMNKINKLFFNYALFVIVKSKEMLTRSDGLWVWNCAVLHVNDVLGHTNEWNADNSHVKPNIYHVYGPSMSKNLLILMYY